MGQTIITSLHTQAQSHAHDGVALISQGNIGIGIASLLSTCSNAGGAVCAVGTIGLQQGAAAIQIEVVFLNYVERVDIHGHAGATA